MKCRFACSNVSYSDCSLCVSLLRKRPHLNSVTPTHSRENNNCDSDFHMIAISSEFELQLLNVFPRLYHVITVGHLE